LSCVDNTSVIQQFVRVYCQDSIFHNDRFKGGRTECFRSLYKCSHDEIIRYLDVTSLYPWVMARKPLPVGKANISLDAQCPDPMNIHGLVKVLSNTTTYLLLKCVAFCSLYSLFCRELKSGHLFILIHLPLQRIKKSAKSVSVTKRKNLLANSYRVHILCIFNTLSVRFTLYLSFSLI
jgi:hypothetical protein